MEKLTSNSLYFDYNSTSPLSVRVQEWLGQGDVFFANTSSLHSSGRKANRAVLEVKNFLLETFGLAGTHNLFFHSGATEGANTIIRGYGKSCQKQNIRFNFFSSVTDHASIYNMKDYLRSEGHHVSSFGVNKKGLFDQDSLQREILAHLKQTESAAMLNFTVVNNEVGMVWDLDQAAEIKKRTGCVVHVDAAQLPGKVNEWWKLSSDLDSYTFSAHKFGGLAGVGFTFIRHGFPFVPLLYGGEQQDGWRPGTVNALGIVSIKLALQDLIERFNYNEVKRAKDFLENSLRSLLGDKGEIIAQESLKRNLNTIFLMVHGQKADILLTAFDLAGIEISGGSACSSGLVGPNRILLNMGYDSQKASSAVRFSFDPFISLKEAKDCYPRIEAVLSKFL